MPSKTILVTGSSGLIGSEVCTHFAQELGYQVHGVDTNQRAAGNPQGLHPSRTRHP
jgi:CDP-paratose 2-epimerase